MLVPDINVLMVAHVLKIMVLLNVTAQMAFPEIIVKRKSKMEENLSLDPKAVEPVLKVPK